MEKIDLAAIGESSEIYLFNAVGISTYVAKTPKEAAERIHALAEAGCKVVYLEEALYVRLTDVLETYNKRAFPIVIPIPSSEGSQGVGLKKIKDNVQRAIGLDIL